ncbi:MAG: MFS transporter [Promethearchaeota archaeon]|nr:MAG: MFS transporter [Candidatus Lokiarchaeota archaeon]
MESHPTRETFKNYIYFWIGQIFTLLGSSIVQFVIPLWITEIYQDEILTSLVYFVSFIPPIIISPIAGVYADKLNRKKMIAFADTSQAITTLILIILFLTNLENFYLILIISLLRSIFQFVHLPPSNAIIPTMVPKEHLSRVNGINYLFTSFINIIGPIVGGVVVSIFPIEAALSIDVITFVIAIIPLILIKIPDIRKEEKKNANVSNFRSDIKEGIKTISVIPGLLILLLLATFANFFIMPLQTLLSNYVLVDNSGTGLIYAFISGSMSLGILIGAIVVTVKKQWNRKILIIFLGVLVQNFGCLIIALSPYQLFSMMMIGAFIHGIFLPIVNTMFLTLIQTKVPTDKQGRVISIVFLISSAITPISIIIAGPLSKIIGISTLWLLYGILGILFNIIIWVSTDLRNIDEYEKSQLAINSKN